MSNKRKYKKNKVLRKGILILLILGLGVYGLTRFYLNYYAKKVCSKSGHCYYSEIIPLDSAVRTLFFINWQSYVSPEFNFSFKYPAEYEIQKADTYYSLLVDDSSFAIYWKWPTPGDFQSDLERDRFYQYINRELFHLIVQPKRNTGNLTCRDYLANELRKKKHFDPSRNWAEETIEVFENYSNGELKGIKVDLNWHQDPAPTICLAQNDLILIFSLLGGTETGAYPTLKAKIITERIISTLKFPNSF